MAPVAPATAPVAPVTTPVAPAMAPVAVMMAAVALATGPGVLVTTVMGLVWGLLSGLLSGLLWGLVGGPAWGPSTAPVAALVAVPAATRTHVVGAAPRRRRRARAGGCRGRPAMSGDPGPESRTLGHRAPGGEGGSCMSPGWSLGGWAGELGGWEDGRELVYWEEGRLFICYAGRKALCKSWEDRSKLVGWEEGGFLTGILRG